MGNKFVENILDGIAEFFENTVVKMIVALAMVGILSGVALTFVYMYAAPRIKINLNKETQRAVRNIFPDLEKTTIIKKHTNMFEDIIKVDDKDGKLLGYAFFAEGNGYQGSIKIMVGIDAGLSKLHGIEILESQETPGLGAEIAEKPFRRQFDGLSVTQPIAYVKNRKPTKPYEIEAITGATISSRAIVNMLNKRITEIKQVLKGK